MSVATVINSARRWQKLAESFDPPKAKATKTATVQATIRPTDLGRWRDDFVGFAALLDIVDKDANRRKLRPSFIQSAFEFVRRGRDIILKPRQVGFTTWELARDIWTFLTRQGARVVVLCQSDKDHKPLQEIAAKLRVMFEGLVASGVRIEVQNDATDTWVYGDAKLQIIEAGGTEAAAAKVGRGGTIQRLHITELAFFEFARVTMNSILECVPASGEVTIESTANGAAGPFFERYKQAKAGRGGYKPHFFRWLDQQEYATPLEPGETMVPETDRERTLLEKHGATLEQLKWARQKLEDKGEDDFDQEYPVDEETCWLTAGRVFFDKGALKKALAGCIVPAAIEQAGALRIWKHPSPERTYVIIADTSSGTGKDPSGAGIYDRESGEHVATLQGHFEPHDLAAALEALGYRWNTATVVVERNNHGHAVLQSLTRGDQITERKPYPRVFDGADGKPGWHTTPVSRPAALSALQAAVKDGVKTGHWATPDRNVIGEMATFIVHKDGKAAATSGAHDELVLVSAIAWDVLSKPFATVMLPTRKPTPYRFAAGGGGRGF